MSRAAASARKNRRLLLSALGVPDRRRWLARKPDDPGFQTPERSRAIAAFVPAASSVLDLGAGFQSLRRFLPPECEYQPCDLTGGPGVFSCDFNAGRYPSVSHRFDIVVASALLEWLRDPVSFLARLPALGDTLLLSYRPRRPAESLWGRLRSGYLSHYTEAELEDVFAGLGYDWARVGGYEHDRGPTPHVQPIYRIALSVGGGARRPSRGERRRAAEEPPSEGSMRLTHRTSPT